VNVLITGVTGFVGAHLAASLQKDGIEVAGLARDPSRSSEVKLYGWDDPRAFADTNAIVHLAGESVAGLWTAKRKERIEKSRTERTRTLVDAIAKLDRRPDVLVSASAVGYYGDPNDDRPIDEDRPRGEGFLADVCDAWEREAIRAESLGVRVVRVRISLVLGKGGGTLGAMLPSFKLGAGGRIGSGEQLWPWIHEDDLVRMIRRAIDDPSWSGAYNAAAPEPVKQITFAKTLASILHRPSFMPAPAFAIKAILGDFASEILVSRNVVPKRAIEAGFTFDFGSLEPALRDLVED
jgi:uncharacterized protein (TIGR01777 family)